MLIIEVFYHSRVNARYWRPGFYQCGTILVNVAFSLKILIIPIINFSESQKDTKLYMDVLSACVPRIFHCSINIFEIGNRKVIRFKLVSKPCGLYIRCYKIIRISSFLTVQKHKVYFYIICSHTTILFFLEICVADYWHRTVN